MATIIYGERVGREGKLGVGCSAEETAAMNIGAFDRQRINDGFAFNGQTFVKEDFGWR